MNCGSTLVERLALIGAFKCRGLHGSELMVCDKANLDGDDDRLFILSAGDDAAEEALPPPSGLDARRSNAICNNLGDVRRWDPFGSK